MEKLSPQRRTAVLQCLIEGNSVWSTSRITGTAKNTILDYLEEAGEACAVYHELAMRDLPCKTLQLDEIWSFVGCKEKAKMTAKQKHPGDVWTWTSLCSDTKIIPAWRVGDRSANTAFAFCADLAQRFTGTLQITTDGLESYRWAIAANFGEVDFAQLVKIYGKDEKGADCVVGIRKHVVSGMPDMDFVSTSYVERSNLTIRMTNRRFTRKTNGFSKKIENHCHMLAIGFMSYNFCRKHATVKMTPAQAAGVSTKRWTVEDVVEMIAKYAKDKEDAAFEDAFKIRLTPPRTTPKTYEPQAPLTPWYLDPDSGGPNPLVKKEGIQYQTGDSDFS